MAEHPSGVPPRWPELEQVAVLMPSCDRYGSLWPLSLGAMQRLWPQRPGHTVLVANARAVQFAGVRQLLVGEDRSWSDNLRVALEAVHQEYVFLALDDLVMMPGTDGPSLSALIAHAVRERWNYLRVNPLPPPPACGPDGLGEVPAGAAYRSALVWSLWRRRVLQAVLAPGESAWQFEKPGSARTDRFGRWWASARTTIRYANLVTAGRLEPRALQHVRAQGWPTDDLEFAPMGPAQSLVHHTRLLRSRALRAVPHRWRRTLQRAVSWP